MTSTTIRPLTPDDMERMEALLQTRDDTDPQKTKMRLKILSWLAFENPFADDQPTYFIADNGKEIIAHLGKMPIEFIIDGRLQKGYFIHDLFVHPNYRKNGGGFFLSMQLYQSVEKSLDSFALLIWTNKQNLAMQKTRGYHELYADRYRKFIYPDLFLKKHIKPDILARLSSFILRKIMTAIDWILCLPIPTGIPVRKIKSLSDQFDQPNPNLIQNIGICPFPSSQYLNWHYINNPFSEMEILIAEENDQIRGYIVLCTILTESHHEGFIVDIMVNPNDKRTLRSLLRASVKYMRSENVNSIRCCLSDPKLSRFLKSWLFFRNNFKKEPIMLANFSNHEEHSRLIDIRNWHITYGVSDAFVFKPSE